MNALIDAAASLRRRIQNTGRQDSMSEVEKELPPGQRIAPPMSPSEIDGLIVADEIEVVKEIVRELEEGINALRRNAVDALRRRLAPTQFVPVIGSTETPAAGPVGEPSDCPEITTSPIIERWSVRPRVTDPSEPWHFRRHADGAVTYISGKTIIDVPRVQKPANAWECDANGQPLPDTKITEPVGDPSDCPEITTSPIVGRYNNNAPYDPKAHWREHADGTITFRSELHRTVRSGYMVPSDCFRCDANGQPRPDAKKAESAS